MKWCNPCALIWLVIASAFASHVWLNVDWTYIVPFLIVSLPVIAIAAHEEREDIYFALQGIVNEIWWLLKNRAGKEPTRRSTVQEAKDAR